MPSRVSILCVTGTIQQSQFSPFHTTILWFTLHPHTHQEKHASLVPLPQTHFRFSSETHWGCCWRCLLVFIGVHFSIGGFSSGIWNCINLGIFFAKWFLLGLTWWWLWLGLRWAPCSLFSSAPGSYVHEFTWMLQGDPFLLPPDPISAWWTFFHF